MNRRWFLDATLAILSLAPLDAYGGFITEQTAALDTIYSQASFGSTPVEIRFNPGLTFARPDLLSIDNAAEQNSLFALAPTSAPTIDAFFVDSISYCFGSAPSGINFVGCAQLPGHELFLNSAYASINGALGFSTAGAVVLGHELGHNLDLGHIGNFSATGNLMNPLLNSDVLTADQVATILSSPLIQFDPDGDRFITITPIAITAQMPVQDPVAVSSPPIGQVTEPVTLPLWIGAVLLALFFRPSSHQKEGAAR